MDHIVSRKYTPHTTILSYADDIVIINTNPSADTLSHDLLQVEKCCEHLGLKISAGKSKVLHFTANNQHYKIPFDLHIQNEQLVWVKEYKYLGITLDNKLCLNKHIDVIKSRVSARLNVMRAISGHRGGASYHVLNTFYCAAIRSVIEYGNTALVLASKTRLKELDRLQNYALWLINRAPRWTNIATMEHATNIPPLEIRRINSNLKIIDKTLRDETHPNHIHMRTLFCDNSIRFIAKSWNSLARETWNRSQLTMPPIEQAVSNPPWSKDNVIFIINTPDTKKADCNPSELKSKALEQIDYHYTDSSIIIYTDGACDPNTGHAGCGIYIRYKDKVIKLSLRTEDHASSLQTELMAINQALSHANALSIDTKLVLCTDSLGALQTLKQKTCKENTDVFSSIKSHLKERTAADNIFIWIPSHTGIPGNEIADQLAKAALSRESQDINFPVLSRSKQRCHIAKYTSTLFNDYLQTKTRESNTFAEYVERTNLNRITLPRFLTRLEEKEILYLNLGYKLYLEDPFSKFGKGNCPDCQTEIFSLLHHLFACTKHETESLNLTSNIPDNIVDEKEKLAHLSKVSLHNPQPILNFFKIHPLPWFKKNT
jgi:ribonuclease HI